MAAQMWSSSSGGNQTLVLLILVDLIADGGGINDLTPGRLESVLR